MRLQGQQGLGRAWPLCVLEIGCIYRRGTLPLAGRKPLYERRLRSGLRSAHAISGCRVPVALQLIGAVCVLYMKQPLAIEVSYGSCKSVVYVVLNGARA